jgi:hypothetical protein
MKTYDLIEMLGVVNFIFGCWNFDEVILHQPHPVEKFIIERLKEIVVH